MELGPPPEPVWTPRPGLGRLVTPSAPVASDPLTGAAVTAATPASLATETVLPTLAPAPQLWTDYQALPPEAQPAYRAQLLRLGQWSLPAYAEIESFSFLTVTVTRQLYSYQGNTPYVQVTELLQTVRDSDQWVATQGERLGRELPHWARRVVAHLLEKYLTLSADQLRPVLETLSRLRQAARVMVGILSVQYLRTTTTRVGVGYLDELFKHVAPGFQLPGRGIPMVGALLQELGDSELVEDLRVLVEAVLDELRAQHQAAFDQILGETVTSRQQTTQSLLLV